MTILPGSGYPNGYARPAWFPNSTALVVTSLGTGKLIRFDLPSRTMTVLGPSGYNATVSPSGSVIVFEGSGLRMMNASGGASLPVTTAGSHNMEPAWAPTSIGPPTIVYASDRSGNLEIWAQELTGVNVRQITFDPAADRQPAWSPDGRWIAFSSDRGGGIDIWVVAAAGGLATPITNDGSYNTEPSWSPDSQEIAFVSNRTGRSRVWVASDLGLDTVSIQETSISAVKRRYR